MTPLEDSITPVTAVSVDRPAVSGVGAQNGTKQNQSAKPPANADDARGDAQPAAAPRIEVPGEDAHIFFVKDAVSGRMVMQLKDSSGKLIRQIPPEEMLRLAKAIDQYLGLLVDRHS